jgi:hypothetical protein
MTFGISGAALAGIAVGGATLYSANRASKAAGDAADVQSQSALAGIEEQRRQFDAIQKLLGPYAQGGATAFQSQQDLLGLGAPGAQQQAIQGIQSGPQFQALNQAGQEAILQNASATGGLRGGNTQAALAQFSPQLLNQLIQQQYSSLGGISQMGQASAAGQASAGMQTGNNIANLLQQQGAAQAGGALAQGRAAGGFGQAIGAGLGIYTGMGGGF